MATCPACQSGELEEFSGKMLCSNPRCLYKETCSDGGCMISDTKPVYHEWVEDLLSTRIHGDEYRHCPKCERKVHKSVITHNCPGIPEFREAPSTAASDYGALAEFITVCVSCGESTSWTNRPQGIHWMCKCGKVQLLA